MDKEQDKWFYPSGALYCLRTLEKREYYYENGSLKTRENYREERLEGEATLYWPNGQIKRKCSFSQGVRHGLDQMWSEEGILVDEGNYEKGTPVGVHRRYGQKGHLLEEITYLAPPRFNLRQWDEQGTLRVEAIWIDGDNYFEKTWDRFQQIWIEKEGRWDGKKLVYV